MSESKDPLDVPILRYGKWKYLLRALQDRYKGLLPCSTTNLEMLLAPSAGIAWWIATFRPELLGRSRLNILVAGAGSLECMDAGRWFHFLPWMLGMREGSIAVTLVGDELCSRANSEPMRSVGMSGPRLEASLRSSESSMILGVPSTTIVNGRLSDWRRAWPDAQVDLSVIFSPGLEEHSDDWFREDELLPILRSGSAVAAMSYSRMDHLHDRHIAGLYGLTLATERTAINPWHLRAPEQDEFGTFGLVAWELTTTRVPAKVRRDKAGWARFRAAQPILVAEFKEGGGDAGLERLGQREAIEIADTGKSEVLYRLPFDAVLVESNRTIYQLTDGVMVRAEPEVVLDQSWLDCWPREPGMERLLWAVEAVVEARSHVPRGEEQAPVDGCGPIGIRAVTQEDLYEYVRKTAKQALGRDVEPRQFMQNIRLAGGLSGPGHPCWHDLLVTLGWDLRKYDDTPPRFHKAFEIWSDRLGRALPAVCENYLFLPDDADDELAGDAMRAVEKRFPKGALLLFKGMPYRSIEGHDYSFGGLLYLEGTWRKFALNEHMKSLDVVLDQIAAGFSFEKPIARYEDAGQRVALPFSRLCQGQDPNLRGEAIGLRSGLWNLLVTG